MSTKISVIIPCYNQAHLLPDAVHSVQAQTLEDWECLIINDGSPDNTEQVAREFCAADKRIRLISKQNGGLSSARNAGLDEAAGEYIQFLDADDVLDTHKFSKSLEAGAGSDIIMTRFNFFTSLDQPLTAPGFTLHQDLFRFEAILKGWESEFVFPPHCGLFKSSLFSNLRFNETLKAREDWMMWLQIYLREINTCFIDEPLVLYRVLPNSMSKKRALMNESQVAVFRLLYPLVPEKYHTVFFDKVILTLEKIITDTEQLLTQTRASKSYRLGNFFVRNFNRLTRHQ